MKKMIIMRGLPGSGKSSWIKDKGYELCTLSMDTLRLMIEEPNPTISQEHNRFVYGLFTTLLEKRLQTGSFTVVDNVNLTKSSIRDFLKLAEEYEYEVEFQDFTDVPLLDILERNELRSTYKQVPEDVLKRMYDQKENSKQYFNDVTKWK